MPKRTRSRSADGIRPDRAKRPTQELKDLHEFAADLKETVNKLLPTGGQRFDRSAILAIDFSDSDIDCVVSQRNELLGVLKGDYNWTVVRHTIDCSQLDRVALAKAQDACSDFLRNHASETDTTGALLCVYFSGHGFMDGQHELNVCGSMRADGKANGPYCKWSLLTSAFQSRILSEKDHKLAIIDCCAAGLASLQKSDVEVIGATAWESTAPSVAGKSFTRAIIDQLKALKGKSITTTQLISRLHSLSSVRKGMSMPVHRGTLDGRPPAIIHRIENTTSPHAALPQVKAVSEYSHVIVTVKVANENTIPNPKQWAQWLSTNLPDYIGEIEIKAEWKTGSALVVFVLPIEIWLSLPARDAYCFVDYHRAWDASEARQRHRNLLSQQQPPQPAGQPMTTMARGSSSTAPHQRGRQLQEQVQPGTGTGTGTSRRQPGSQQTTPLVSRSGNVPRPDDEPESP